jgi:hypothetical protein
LIEVDPEADWDALEQALRGCERVTGEECAYLKNAFLATERMWAEEITKGATVRLVHLSEAPLFGSNRRYFYNLATPFGAFFHFRDAEAVLGQDFAKGRTGKEFLLTELAGAGFIILDLVPFALNKDDTPSVTYRKMSVSRYRKLFQRTASLYFDKKRDVILCSPRSRRPVAGVIQGSRGPKVRSGWGNIGTARSIKLILKQGRFFAPSSPTASSPG